jgi:DNA modification methylase
MTISSVNKGAWPADNVERRPIGKLIPYARNARTHSPAQVDQIASSIREWGWTVPVLLDEQDGIIAGHGRVLAAKKLGLQDIPCMVARGWSEAQRQAYVLADNKLTLNGGWDNDLLKGALGDLQGMDFDLSLTGFSMDEIGMLMADKTAGLTDPDEAPEPPAIPVSELGDVWLLGNHRLVCGDSTSVESVDKALNGVKPHLMVTDPPYGVKYDPNWQMELGKTADGTIQRITSGKVVRPNPKTNIGSVLNDDKADWREAWSLFPGDVAYVWHADRFSPEVAESLRACGFGVRNLIIWAKSQLVMSRGNYHSRHEPCWYTVRKDKTGHWSGDRKQTTLWEIDKPMKSETGHGTQKPVECMKRPIENNSSPGQAVYEPFSGSGTTIIAGEMTGRSVHAIELSPAYVDVAIERWQNFTGMKATLDGTQSTFEEIKAQRIPVASPGSDTSSTPKSHLTKRKDGKSAPDSAHTQS